MSKLEETNAKIDTITEVINTSNPPSAFSLNSMCLLSGIIIFCDIAKSLAIIADSISKENDNKKI